MALHFNVLKFNRTLVLENNSYRNVVTRVLPNFFVASTSNKFGGRVLIVDSRMEAETRPFYTPRT